MKELKPCPFCGSTVEWTEAFETPHYYITCGNDDCGLTVSRDGGWGLKKDEVWLWNRRVE